MTKKTILVLALASTFFLSFFISMNSSSNEVLAKPGYNYQCHISRWIERYCEPGTGDCYDIVHYECVSGFTAGQTPCDWCGDTPY